MKASTNFHPQVRIVQSRRISSLELRRLIYDFRQVLAGKSSGPREVRKSICSHSNFAKVSEFNAHKIVDGLWVPENQSLLIRLLESKIVARRLFIGPNIATENPKLSELILKTSNNRVLVPSESMKDILLDRRIGYLPKDILIWFAGVDHQFWNPIANIERHLVLVYQKGPQSDDRVRSVERNLEELGISFVTLKYGQYRQVEYFKILNQCKFVIWVGHTETQGIAQFQAWAMNTPTLVSGLPKERLNERDGFMASAAPYLSERTGMMAQGEQPTREEIIMMNDSIESFSPRLWVTENATKEIAISNLVKIFNDELRD